MGMSASQARLISLEARQADVEYEAQQINQQRLVLSNKMNDIQNAMYNMDVPVPPSKQDFMYNVYKGKTQNGKKITAKMNDMGQLVFTKAVNGHIVQDGGKMEVTSGAKISGSEINTKNWLKPSGDGSFHECDSTEDANAYRAGTLTDPDKLTVYKESDYTRVYDKSNPKTFAPQDGEYTANNAQGTSYAKDAQSAYITIPVYTPELDAKGGQYGDNSYDGNFYGENGPEVNETKWRMDGTDYTEAELTSKEKTPYEPAQYDEKGNVTKAEVPATYYSTSDATEVHNYNLYDKKTGAAAGTTEFLPEKPTTSKLPASYHFVKSGEEKVPLTYPLEKGTYDTELNEQVTKFEDLLSGKTKADGIAEEVGNFVIDGTSAKTEKFDIKANSQFKYSMFVGEEDVTGSFENNDKAIYKERGDGDQETGASIVKHNNDAKTNLGKKYFIPGGDGFKEVSGQEALDSGNVFYEKTTSGVGLTNKVMDFSNLKTDMYVIDENGNAFSVEKMGIEEAQAKIKSGWKVMQPGSGGKDYQNGDRAGERTVAGSATMTLGEADEKYGNDPNYSNALTGLKQSFPDNYKDFTVIVSQDEKNFSFCLTSDLEENSDGQVRVYNHAMGEYDEELEAVGDENVIEWDENGNPLKVQLPGNPGEIVKLEVSQECKEGEFAEATNKYNLKKIEYDREQNELNKQTSIYQRQDKQLELKLTRLDTERNALNTEIDAVKKVIQDATESGFKTFSG